MIISAQALHRYLDKMSFPFPILSEKGDDVVYHAFDKNDIRAFMSDGSIIGVGSWNKLKKLRLNPNASPAAKARMQRELGLRLPGAEDNSTVVRVSRTFTFHAGRSSAYNRGRGLALNSHCL